MCDVSAEVSACPQREMCVANGDKGGEKMEKNIVKYFILRLTFLKYPAFLETGGKYKQKDLPSPLTLFPYP